MVYIQKPWSGWSPMKQNIHADVTGDGGGNTRLNPLIQ